jgi:signal transduction histidine kinase/ligand-binding sensor domain-containing protein/CheY-like chemotaxis protein
MPKLEITSSVQPRSFGPPVASCRVLRLIRVIVLLATGASWAMQAPLPDGVKRLPVIEMQDIRFVRLTSGGEALNAWVRGIAQDNQGFIWLASDTGLYRYDGYVLKQYRHDPGDLNSIGSDEIESLFIDRNGILWIGGAYGGLDRFDPGRGVFTHYRHESGVEGSLDSGVIFWIYQDSRGTLWFATVGGLDRLDPGAGTFVHYKHDPRDPDSLSNSLVYRVYEDRRGNLWVGTEQGLNKLDRATGRATRFLHDPLNPHSLGGNRVRAIGEDRSGTILVGAGNGLSALDVNSGEFTRYSFHSAEPSRDDVAGVIGIHEEADGALWLGTDRDGLFKLDVERKQFRRYARDPSNPGSLPSNCTDAIYEDREGMVWVGTQTGVSRFLRRSPAFVNYRAGAGKGHALQDNEITAVQADRRGLLWIGTQTALHRLDRETGRVSIYRNDPHNPNSISHNAVSTIREDRSGKLWFGTYGGGLNLYDPVAERFLAYRSDPKKAGSLSSDTVWDLLVDHEGTLWVGTQFGGLNRHDPATKRFKTYRSEPGNPHSLSNDNVTALFEDRAGELWVGTVAGGLNRFDRKSQQFTRYRFDSRTASDLPQVPIRSMHEDSRGVLWVGTADGLYRREPSSESFTRFTTKDGLPNTQVGAILEDRNGDLWLATKHGLLRIAPRTGQFRNYLESDGLPGNYFAMQGSEAACQTPGGELVFGSTNGLTVFDPDRLSTNPYVPTVVLTDLLLFNKTVRPGKGSPLQQPIWATGSLTLNHDQNIFSLEFAALSYAAPQHNRYRYRLEGLEDNWNEVDSTRRLATYNSLPAGKYVFRVQGSNNDLLWNQAGVRLTITVLRPWWGTWWFRASAGLCLAALVLAAYRFRVKGLQLAAKKLEIQVASRTRELQAAMHSAELAKDAALTAEHAAEAAKDAAETANHAKSAFLAHMSHELRTPLNAILGFAGLLRQNGVPGEFRESVDIIHRSGEHLLILINDVLDLAKIESGKQQLAIAPCDLIAMVCDVTEMMRGRANAKNLPLACSQSPGFPQYVLADAPKLRQVLINLLGNAIKFTSAGAITLQLSSTLADKAGRVRLRFQVEDTGIGISQEDQARIFEPFVQVGKPMTHKGTGLGLAITRSFVEMMGGTIALESAPGRGSRFTVEVPAGLARESEVPGARVDAEHLFVLETGQPECRVLIAEDDPENAMVLEQMLCRAGFQVRVVGNGALAIDAFEQWRPDFIWMDLNMPEMSGAEAARRVRALDGGREVKIAALTASVFASERDQVLAAGMDELVRKPYRPEEVFDCMSRQLGVRYRHIEVASGGTEESGLLRQHAIAALPHELRREVAEAIISLNRERIVQVIDRLAETDRDLASALSGLADQYAYTAILTAFENAGQAIVSAEQNNPRGT